MSSQRQEQHDYPSQPPHSDPSWQRRCQPLLLFRETPRGWEELSAWASERAMSASRLRNMLAWLEGEGIAGAFTPRLPQIHDVEAPRAILWRCFAARAGSLTLPVRAARAE